MKRLVIAGGGTGGHIYPALAVARSLRARPDPPDLHWIGGHRGLEDQLVGEAGIPLSRLVLRSLRSTDISPHLVLDPIRLGASVPQAAAVLARLQPSAVFTTGGFVAIPVLMAAASMRIPVLLWDGNVVPGRAVRTTARLADVVAVSYEATCRALGADTCYVTGTPIRDPAEIDRVAAREALGIPAGARVLLVFGGSQSVQRFNAAVAEALPRLVESCHVVHVTGDDAYADALAAREELPADLRERYRPHPFLREEMTAALAAADLVVGRAGSSTLAEVTAFGLPMIVVPYPHAAGHQRANARILAEAGAARLIEDDDFDAAALLDSAALLASPRRHAEMSAAARALGRPGAAAAVVELLVVLADRRPLPDAAVIERISRRAVG